LAVLQSKRELARALLEHGADPNVTDRDGMGLVQIAAKTGSIELMTALLSKQVNPNVVGPAASTPLHAAALWKDSSGARLLLDHGADVAPRDDLGNTPLHVAARAGKKEVVRLLLERGAPVDARNKRDLTPLDLAENNSNYAIEPGRGLVEAFDRRGTQVQPIAARVPTDIADLLRQHGAGQSSTGQPAASDADATSIVPPPP
jgi:ankyrin repeat protein